MRRFVWRYCPAASRGSADCPPCDRVEMLAAEGVCPAAVAAATKIRSRTPVRSSLHWSCCLRNLALLFKKHCPRQTRRPLTRETSQSHLYPLTSIEPAIRMMRLRILTLWLNSDEMRMRSWRYLSFEDAPG